MPLAPKIEARFHKITKSLFILDRRFYRKNNIKEMISERIDFILPLPFGSQRKSFEHFEKTAGNFAKYFECAANGKVISLRRRSNARSQAMNRSGKNILISSTKWSWDEVLSLYQERDGVEKKFDDLKNELEVMPLRTLMESAKIRAVKVGGKWRLTEISKNKRTILEKMKIGVPVEADKVMKKAGI